MLSIEDICQKISCWMPDVKRLLGYILKVSTRLSRCNSVKRQAKHLLGLIWVDTDKSVDPAHKTIRSRLCARERKTKRQGKIQRASVASQLFSAMPPLQAVQVLVSFMMSVGWLSKAKPLTTSAERISKEQPRESYMSVFQRVIDRHMEKTKLADEEHVRNSRCFSHLQLDNLWRTGVIPKRQTPCRIVPQSNQDVSFAVHGDDFVCLSDGDGLNRIASLPKLKNTEKGIWEHLESKKRTQERCDWLEKMKERKMGRQY